MVALKQTRLLCAEKTSQCGEHAAAMYIFESTLDMMDGQCVV